MNCDLYSSAGNQDHGDTFNAENLLELHRKQILQNTGGGNGYNYQNGSSQHSNATTPDATNTSASSSAAADANLQQQSFANSRWSNMSSPALQYYGQHNNTGANGNNNASNDGNNIASAIFAAAPGSHGVQNPYVPIANGSTSAAGMNHAHLNTSGSMLSSDEITRHDNSIAGNANGNPTVGVGGAAMPAPWNSNVMTSNHPLQQQQPAVMANPDVYTTNQQAATVPNAGGVFYMAVPSTSHNNNPATLQLQPVQMMQLPNGQQTLVFAPHAQTSIPNSHSMPNLQMMTPNGNANSGYRVPVMHSQTQPQRRNTGRRNHKGHNRNKEQVSSICIYYPQSS